MNGFGGNEFFIIGGFLLVCIVDLKRMYRRDLIIDKFEGLF